MTARRAMTAARVRRILLAQADEAGAPIPCTLCGAGIAPSAETTMEHLHALGLGGADDDENVRIAHAACSKIKTIGAKATTAGSDIHLIAKGKRLRGEVVKKPRGRKVQGRGFAPGKRPLRRRPPA